MKRKAYILLWFAIAILSAGISGCTDDNVIDEKPRDPNHPIEVAFTAERLTEGFMTRAGAKAEFKEGDVIQVSAVFSFANGDTETQYTCREMNADGEWGPGRTDTPMTWPIEAVKGTFTAYYIPSAQGALAAGEPLKAVLLEDVTDETDPLVAQKADVAYGHAVHLQFTHLCTRLILQHVKSANADEYWLTCDNDGGLKNAYQITLNTENELDFEFIISGTFDDATPAKIARTKANDEVTFYLAPGDYNNMKLNYSYYRPYLQFDADKDKDIDVIKNLEAHHSYILDVSKTLGAINIEEEPEWNDPDKDKPVELGGTENIQEFLKAIEEGTDYYAKEADGSQGVQVLSSNGSGTVTLLKNVDFQSQNKGISGIVPNTITFNGNHYNIMNLADALFENLYGNVFDLGLIGVDIDYSFNEEPTGDRQTQIGALSRYSSGDVNNVRLKNIDIEFQGQNVTGRAFDVGGLIGGNTSEGDVSDIVLEGTINVKSTGNTMSELNLGGVIGQNGGTLSAVSFKDENSTLTVTSGIGGSGTLSTGGIVGVNTGTVNNSILTVTVDASKGKGTHNYVGGLVGDLNGGMLHDCAVDGSVKGGDVEGDSSMNSLSYAGGIAGCMGGATMETCTSFNEVVGFTDMKNSSDMKAYTAAGLIGGLSRNESSVSIKNCATWSTLSNAEYIGWVAGVWPTGFAGTEEDNTNNTTVTERYGVVTDETYKEP